MRNTDPSTRWREMTFNRSQFAPNGHDKKNGLADLSGSPGLPEPSEAVKSAKSPIPEPAPRTADFLSYRQRDKVTTSRFPGRRRGLATLLTARTVPVLVLFLEFAAVATASFGAGVL